jgi:protein-tyrosine sulfotransferase
MGSIAPMLDQLGYDPNANPPNYGKPDDIVVKKTHDVHANKEKWQAKIDDIMHKDDGNLETPVEEDKGTDLNNNNKNGEDKNQNADFDPGPQRPQV